MIYRSIKLVLCVLMLFTWVSGLSITLAAPHAQATATPTRLITATVTVTSTRQIRLLECYEAYTVQPTDTLSKVAQRFYGAAVNFSVIIEATNAMALSDKTFTLITDTNRMKVGQKLCIINTPDLPIISRTATITLSSPPLTTVAQIAIPTSSPILNQPIAPSLKIGEQIIEVPEDKAALTVENLSPVDLVFDLIGPSEQSYVIGTGQKWPMIIQPGSHSFNIHAATGEVEDLPIAPGSFEVEVKQVAELIVFARSVEISKRNLGAIPTATRANPVSNPAANTPAPTALPLSATPALPATTPTLPVVSTLPRNAITATNTPLATSTSSVKMATATQAPPPKATPQPAATATSIPSTVTTKTTTLQTTPSAIVTTISTKTATLQTTPLATTTTTATKTATIQATATMSVTATPITTKTATLQPTMTSTVITATRPIDDSKKKLAPPEGQGRLYFQNFYRETATFTLNNQPITLEVEMIKMIDLPPATTSFQVSISRGAGQGQIDLAANTSWLVRLDPNGGLGWVQVYP